MYEANYRCYGVGKMYHQLRRDGHRVARCTVRRLMRELGIQGLVRGRVARTTAADLSAQRPDDLVARDSRAAAPNRLWVADVTYIRTWSGWVYAAFVIDVYSRMVVGWQLATHVRTDLVLDALEMAIWRRRHDQAGHLHHADRAGHADLSRLIHHSDRGVQYLSIRYTERLAEAGAVSSVGSRGDSYDNALAESFNGIFKAELIRRHEPWRGLDDVELAALEYLDWYNHRRLHTACDHRPPMEFEAIYYRHNYDSVTTAETK